MQKLIVITLMFFFFVFKQKTANEVLRSSVGSEMCKRDINHTLYLKSACCSSEIRVKLSAAQWLRK